VLVLSVLQVAKWIGNKPRLIIVNRRDMISNADAAAWDKYYSADAAAAAAAKAAARKKAEARAAAKAAAAAAADGQDDDEQQQQQQQQQEEDQEEGEESQQQPDQLEELQPPSMPQQVFWTDGKTGAAPTHADRRLDAVADMLASVLEGVVLGRPCCTD
jgi:outer membrane protein OmpA-like peptidoglycan-associated protein